MALCRSWGAKPPAFLYPSDVAVDGSTTVFTALWQRMLARKVAALARFEPRSTSAPHIVALIPESEVVDEATGTQVRPAGMHAVILPYADDLRNITAQVDADDATGARNGTAASAARISTNGSQRTSHAQPHPRRWQRLAQ